MNGAGRFGDSYFVSYRDPNLRETNEVYEGIVPYLEQFEADERDMTKFVIGTISDLDAPLLPPYKGIRADAAWFTGVTDAMIQKERDEILAVTPEDIRELAPIIRAVLSEQSICAIGNAEKVFSNVKQGTDISISLFPDNPVMGTVNLHAKSSNKLILKTVKKGEDVSGSIVGVGMESVCM